MLILDTAASMAEMVLLVFYLAAPVSPRASNQAKTHLHHFSHAISHQTTPHMQFLNVSPLSGRTHLVSGPSTTSEAMYNTSLMTA